MQIVHQVIDKEGLNIPLPIIEQYGLFPGVDVVLELDTDGIRIRPAVIDRSGIESMALVYLLGNVGDGVQVKAERRNGNWHVAVHSPLRETPLGYLVYAQDGTLIEEESITPNELLATQ
jgi:hypothetical protein